MFDSSDKDVRALLPTVELINGLEEAVSTLSDEALRGKTQHFKDMLASGTSLDDMLPEAFAVVREVSKRLLHMRHFDVQLVGGMVLHQGRISEMRTGEGKTLVAVAPLYLNSLGGKGAHLVTANDYLARRDAAWMGPIYNFLGVSVGVVQGQSDENDERGGSYIYDPEYVDEDPRYARLRPCSRREAYLCDVTYGTNHEFGFDYLRDNMAYEMDQLSMSDLNYAIIDEVDSILVDEARTPHIISGASSEDVSQYKMVNEVVKTLQNELHYTADKKNHSASLTEEGMDYVEEQLNLPNIASDPRIFHHVNACLKAHALFQRDVDYVVRGNEVAIVDENTGRIMHGRRYSDGLHQALEAKEGVQVQRESQTVAVITFQNLFRLYGKLAGMTGTAKTEEDEFRKIYGLDVVTIPTHRDSQRVDHDDVIYKTLEGKMRGIANELMRLYVKQQPVLVGTRSIEMTEVVSERLTPDMLQRLLLATRLYDFKEEKKGDRAALKAAEEVVNMPLAEISRDTLSAVCAQAGFSGDALNADHWTYFSKKHGFTDANREYFDEALKHGIPHNVLNAKYHEREALIISEAGRKGALTIATNMAGRGVDILLGGRVADDVIKQAQEEEQRDGNKFAEQYANTFASFRRGGVERAAPPLPLDDQERRGLADEVRALGGLYILGTERHESRRIDNQLRGRSGRQGDPGESRFYVSLEDQLWKIFNQKMLENPTLKLWPPMEEVKAGFLSSMIRKTQERIESHFFEARKNVLEYDDVLNSQREHIYGVRREVLLGRDTREDIKEGLDSLVRETVVNANSVDEDGRVVFNWEYMYEELNTLFPLVDYATINELEQHGTGEELIQAVTDIAHDAMAKREASMGEDDFKLLAQRVMLQVVNDQWQDHLQMLDYIREGIGLRGYGQVDPLVAYKRETYDLFQATLRHIREESVKLLFRAELRRPQEFPEEEALSAAEVLGALSSPPSSEGKPGEWPDSVDPKFVGRNETCPCGSGLKFKACHYAIFREKGTI